MKLYKYKPLNNLWHVLDIALNERLYCAPWRDLNDPLEGRYEIYLGDSDRDGRCALNSFIESTRNKFRIAALSANATNFLLWSHYADGHKGVAIEIEIPDNHPDLTKIVYSPFSSIFTNEDDIEEDMRHIFNGKTEEWSYEEEYRIITNREYFYLPLKPSRILLGPMVDDSREVLLRKTLSTHIDIVNTKLDRTQGTISIVTPRSSS